ncbi:MAG: pyroglutamyl-peptidase I [Polaromonas sp.]
MPCVLLTGFDAFGNDRLARHPVNPSWLAVQALHGSRLEGHAVVAAQLPTVFGAATAELMRLVGLHRPALVVCVGQAGGRSALSLERVAVNLVHAHIPDNAGAQPQDQPVVPGAPAAYFSTLPVTAMFHALQTAGLPAELSYSAGPFVCNHVFYGLMHALATQPGLQGVRGGFIHVPYVPSQGVPSLALDDTVRGLRLAVACALARP